LLGGAARDRAHQAEIDGCAIDPRREAALTALRRCAAASEFRKDVDLDVLADALWGPILHRVLVTRGSIDRKVVDHLLDIALDGALRRPRP
jgi:hypothetical protein